MIKQFITRQITLRGDLTKESSNHNQSRRDEHNEGPESGRPTGKTEQETGIGKVVNE